MIFGPSLGRLLLAISGEGSKSMLSTQETRISARPFFLCICFFYILSMLLREIWGSPAWLSFKSAKEAHQTG